MHVLEIIINIILLLLCKASEIFKTVCYLIDCMIFVFFCHCVKPVTSWGGGVNRILSNMLNDHE